MDARSQEKKKRLEEALERGVVMVHLDARRAGVLVPQKFRGDYHLRLNLSYNFDPPDLTVGDWGARQTLSFNRTPFKVALPWQAIFAITGNSASGQAWLFPEDMPQELLEAAARSQGLTGVPDVEAEVEAEVESDADAAASPGLSVVPSPEDTGESKPRFVPRLVKQEPGADVVRLASAPADEVEPEEFEEPGASEEPQAAEGRRPSGLKLAPMASASPLVALTGLSEEDFSQAPGAAPDEAPGDAGPAAPTEPQAEDAVLPPPDDGKPKRSHLRLVK